MDGVQLPQGQSHYEEAVYFLPLSGLEPPSGFEHGTPGKEKATSVKTKDKITKKHKGQLKMMEDEQMK